MDDVAPRERSRAPLRSRFAGMGQFGVLWSGHVVTLVGNGVLRFAFVVRAWTSGGQVTQVVLLSLCAVPRQLLRRADRLAGHLAGTGVSRGSLVGGVTAFELARRPNRPLTFGHGPHFCLGAQLARTEIQALLACLRGSVARIEVTGPVEWLASNFISGLRHLPVALTAC